LTHGVVTGQAQAKVTNQEVELAAKSAVYDYLVIIITIILLTLDRRDILPFMALQCQYPQYKPKFVGYLAFKGNRIGLCQRCTNIVVNTNKSSDRQSEDIVDLPVRTTFCPLDSIDDTKFELSTAVP